MKMVMFGGDELASLTKKVNGWLEKHPDVGINHILQSAGPPGEGLHGWVVISIWYEEES